MFEGCTAQLKMIKMILEGGFFNEGTYPCEIIRYEEDHECIHLLLLEGELPEISRDAVYQCRIEGEEEEVTCQGMIIERFIDKRGNIMVFQIENGFYKNNLN